MTAAIAMLHEVDPKQEILAEVKPYLADVEPLGTDVLLAMYIRPEKTKSGLYLPENKGARHEDQYQGKVGLVLKMGPAAFREDDSHVWAGKVPQVGDWIAVNVGDTWSCELGKRRCRIVEDVHCKLIVQRPDIIY